MTTESYTYDQAFAAMCIMEHALEDRAVYDWLRQGEGVCQARDNALEIATAVDAGWQFMRDRYGYDEPFDFEFIPEVMQRIVTQFDAPYEVDSYEVRRACIEYQNDRVRGAEVVA